VYEARQQFLTGARRTDDQDAGLARRDPVRQREKCLGKRIGVYDGMLLVRRRRQNSPDQVRIRRQRQIFSGAGSNRGHGRGRVVAEAAGDDRNADPLRLHLRDQSADVEPNVREHQVHTFAGAQRLQRHAQIFRVQDLGAACHSDTACSAELAC
jgi:hypothetical protein